MDLRSIANACIQVVNKDKKVLWKKSIGYDVNEAGEQIPLFEEHFLKAQVQATSVETLSQMSNLNISGTLRTVYLSADVKGVSVREVRGGDVLVMKDYNSDEVSEWKVVSVQEAWDSWAVCTVAQQ